MRLQTQLVLEQARLKHIKIELSNEAPRITLNVRTALTQQVAEAFGCRELIYVNNTPRSGVDRMILEGEEIEVDVRLSNDNFVFQAVCDSMGKYVAHMDGDGPKLEFHIKFTGYAGIVTDIADRVKVDPLEITLKPSQMPLDLQNEPVQEEQNETACKACEDGIALADGTIIHANGSPCAVRQAAVADSGDEEFADGEQVAGPVLVSAREMGGTHQKRKRGRPKKSEAVIEPEELAENNVDFMEDLVGGGKVN